MLGAELESTKSSPNDTVNSCKEFREENSKVKEETEIAQQVELLRVLLSMLKVRN